MIIFQTPFICYESFPISIFYSLKIRCPLIVRVQMFDGSYWYRRILSNGIQVFSLLSGLSSVYLALTDCATSVLDSRLSVRLPLDSTWKLGEKLGTKIENKFWSYQKWYATRSLGGATGFKLKATWNNAHYSEFMKCLLQAELSKSESHG